jgi:hypothetical protein
LKLTTNLKTIAEADDRQYEELQFFRKEKRRFERMFESEEEPEVVEHMPPQRTDPELQREIDVLSGEQNINSDLLDLVQVFKRRSSYEEYLAYLKTQMAGKDRNEFSNYPILNHQYTILLEKFKRFPVELEKDYKTYIERIKQKFAKFLEMVTSHFIYNYLPVYS